MRRRSRALDPETVAVGRQRLAALFGAPPASRSDQEEAPDDDEWMLGGWVPEPVDDDGADDDGADDDEAGDDGADDGEAGGSTPRTQDRPTIGAVLRADAGERLRLLRRGQWGVTASHVAIVAILLIATVLLAIYLFLRGRPQPIATPARAETLTAAPTTQAASGPAAGGAASPAVAAEILIHVEGRVAQPGVVRLAAGARVADAIAAAGGAEPDVDLSTLNLARMLVDGEQILVGLPGQASQPPPPVAAPAGAPGASAGIAGPVNLNSATLDQLDGLPGIGPVLAERVVQWREENGGFTSVDDLLEVPGIGESRLEDLRDQVSV